jgi:phospholipase C
MANQNEGLGEQPMVANVVSRRAQPRCRAIAATFACLLGAEIASPACSADQRIAADPLKTDTPIKHVIVVIGENRSFDHVYATFVPQSADSILNLLSEGIVRPDGSPGRHFAAARQFETSGQTSYFIGVRKKDKTAYTTLPPPTLGGAPNLPSTTSPPFPTFFGPFLGLIERSLEPTDLVLLTTGATGAAGTTGPDLRIVNGATLPNGPFQLTGPNLPYDSYTGDTVHEFYQMWQQSDCSIHHATEDNPTGCLNDLYPFVATTFGRPTADHGGGTSMAFCNMQHGDAPLFKKLADEYTISDNYHQPAIGGTGIQLAFLGTGDDIFWSDGNGNPTVPPSGIANPNPQSGTNNQYKVVGRFSNCSDVFNADGVLPIVGYLDSLPYAVEANCEVDHYYMLNNTNPGFLPNGTKDTNGIAAGTSIPPSAVRTIGDALNEKSISWAYYGGAYSHAVNGPTDPLSLAYCSICNFASYASSIMNNPLQRAQHIKDVTDFFAALSDGTLPAVSFVKPDGLVDGHPATSKLDLFEGMLRKILDTLGAKPELKANTALLITFDEGGGYYDSGFIQPLDFFGDGPRIPLVVVSPYSTGGHVVHSYSDHVSILKFIERNWHLAPLTSRSRDNLPNPRAHKHNPYVPVNAPAISDLFDMFNFDDRDDDRKVRRD